MSDQIDPIKMKKRTYCTRQRFILFSIFLAAAISVVVYEATRDKLFVGHVTLPPP